MCFFIAKQGSFPGSMLQNIGFYLSTVEKEETVDRNIQDFLALIFVDHISDRGSDEVI